MKTLLIISHPEIDESSSQQFLIQALTEFENVTVHNLEKEYPNGEIDIEREQALLLKHDRVLFQFPFYWYSSPPLLKKWQDEVLTEHFAFGYRGNKLQDKEFGIVLIVGASEKEYQTGGREGYSMSELTKPYQAMAKKTQMSYRKPLFIFQFPYKTEAEKMDLLIEYQQYVSLQKPASLKAREEWLLKQLDETSLETLPVDNASFILEEAIDLIEDNRVELDELRMHVANYDD